MVTCIAIQGCQRGGGVDQNAKNAKSTEVNEQVVDFDLDKIVKRGYITAIMDNSSTGLFLYKGRPMGYEYELLSIYAETLGVELRFDITPNLNEAFDKLNRGEGDLLAYNLTITKERKERIEFTHYHNLVRQVLVQRKPSNWRKMKLHVIEKSLIRNPVDLIGKEVYVRNGSSYVSRLKNLSDEVGGDILIIEDFPDVETESMIRKVADGTIEYTVVDEDVALVNARYYPILDVKTPISFPQQIAWGLRKNASGLQVSLNSWIDKMRKTAEYYAIYDKYFRSTRASKVRLNSEYFSMSGDKISPYDSLIKIAAISIGWDWKLLAAQISKESKFDPKAKSWVGALGLMQILPSTGKDYGVKNLFDPKQSIEAGGQHISWLQDRWTDKIEDLDERQKFVLASYNVGQGHVQDAVRLTKKFGKDPNKWEDNVEKYLLLKSQPKYYNDPVVKFGYCRGLEPVNYVKDILALYEQYTQLSNTTASK